MAYFHVGDDWGTIRCVCTADLTDVVSAIIKYFDPDNKLGQWIASVKNPATDGHIDYVIQNSTDLYKAGNWRIWPVVTDSGGKETAGDRAIMMVYEQGQPSASTG